MEPEPELVRRLRAGDSVAFHQLVERFHERVYRTAYAVTGDADAAQDVTQETFLRAWRAVGRFRGDATLATWLTRLALSAGADHRRRQRRHLLLRRVLASLPLFAVDPTSVAEERATLDRALAQLRPAERQVLALRYGLDLSLKEIAAIVGCPEGTVKSRLHTALARLRQRLERRDGMTVAFTKEESHGPR